jgi:hypothetical protein
MLETTKAAQPDISVEDNYPIRGLMKRALLAVTILAGLPGSLFGAALGTAARNVIPSDVQQIIAVDYRRMAGSPTAQALHDRVLPENLKQFETALKGVGIVPDRDIDQLAFASFRANNQLRFVGIAQGQFSVKRIVTKLRQRKVKPSKVQTALVYPMGSGMNMTLLDDNTMLFGPPESVKSALEARDGVIQSLNSNSKVTEMMPAVDSAPVWSVLDSVGTQNMMRSALGEAARLADYETVRKRLVGSRYVMDFANGVNFDLDVFTSDRMTAATLSSLLQAGVQFKRMSASGVEKVALDSTNVDSDGEQLKLHFKTDDKRFEALLKSDLFAAVSR